MKIKFHPENPIEVNENDIFCNDQLNHKPTIEKIAGLISNTDTPFTFGVFGTWGSGKTSFMLMLQKYLHLKYGYESIWFDAWKYENDISLVIPLLSQLYNQYKHLGTSILNSLVKVGSVSTISSADLFLKTVSLGHMSTDNIKNEFTQYENKLKEVYKIWTSKTDEAIREFKKQIDKISKDKPLLLFIDDLDRCMPENVIKLLEDLKHFLSVRGCVFIIGADEQALTNGITARYGSNIISGENYLEKIINLSFHVNKNPNLAQYINDVIIKSADSEWLETVKVKIQFIPGVVDNFNYDMSLRKMKQVAIRYLIFLTRENSELNYKLIFMLILIKEAFPHIYENFKIKGYFQIPAINDVGGEKDVIDRHGSLLGKDLIEYHKSVSRTSSFHSMFSDRVRDDITNKRENQWKYFNEIDFLYCLK